VPRQIGAEHPKCQPCQFTLLGMNGFNTFILQSDQCCDILPSQCHISLKFLIMMVDKLTVNDPRVKHHWVLLNGQSYHYLLANPPTPPRATIFLIHGFPDFSHGWRYQVPFLLSMGLRVVVPDMMGYGFTAAPSSLEFYTFKRCSSDMAELAKHLNARQVILLGHDWGGSIVYRIALWQPQLAAAVISICTSYNRPSMIFRTTQQLVETILPNFRYQIQFAGPEVGERIQGKEKLKEFLNAMYSGRGPNGEVGFVPEQGILFENLPKLKKTRLLDEEELDYYAECYAKNGIGPPLNWYKTRELNFRDEMDLAKAKDLRIKVPTLFVPAKYDTAIPPSMARGMERNFTNLTIKEVDASHWALWQRPGMCNTFIQEFLGKIIENEENKAKL
jgi:soluble epoxide hydrolase / lipid-phosphate phosphatase